jgi:hypothetical protein
VQRLSLVLPAVVQVDGASEERVLETFAHTIDVHISVVGRLVRFHGEHWKWIWAMILLPILL